MKIRVDGVRKIFGAHAALDGATLTAEFDHTLALIGPSGGGKSTLLRVLAGWNFRTRVRSRSTVGRWFLRRGNSLCIAARLAWSFRPTIYFRI